MDIPIVIQPGGGKHADNGAIYIGTQIVMDKRRRRGPPPLPHWAIDTKYMVGGYLQRPT